MSISKIFIKIMHLIRASEVMNYYNYLLFPLVFLLPILFFLITRSKANDSLQVPPGPFAWPIIGNILDLDGKKPHLTLAKLAKAYGPLFSLRLGSRHVVVVSSPAAAKEIYKNHDRDLSGRYVPQLAKKIPQVYNSVITMSTECDERWRFLRSTAHTELFSAWALESHSKVRRQQAKKMLEFLGSKEGEVVKIADVLFATMANGLTNAMVSQDIIDCWDKIGEVKRYTKRLVEFAIPGLADLYPAVGKLDFWSKQKAVDYNNINIAIWGNIVSKRRGRQDVGISSRDFLDVLIENSFDDFQIYNLLTELFVSSDTISTAIEWAVAELIRNQETLLKLREELMQAIEENIVSESELANLPFLQACIKETFRLHPPTPHLVPRCAVQTCKVMDYKIPKNSLVLINAYALGRDPGTWEDSQSFKPERFLGKNIDVKGNHYELLPFGGGRRICAGFPLALKQIQLLLASLVFAFDWFLPPGLDSANLDMSEKFGITLAKEKPLLMIPKIKNHLQIE